MELLPSMGMPGDTRKSGTSCAAAGELWYHIGSLSVRALGRAGRRGAQVGRLFFLVVCKQHV